MRSIGRVRSQPLQSHNSKKSAAGRATAQPLRRKNPARLRLACAHPTVDSLWIFCDAPTGNSKPRRFRVTMRTHTHGTLPTFPQLIGECLFCGYVTGVLG